MRRGTPAVTIRLAPELRTALEAIAADEKKDLSEVMRDAIRIYVAVKQTEKAQA